MRLPNGFGSVYKLSGKRRKPYVARITVDRKYKNPETGKAYIKYRVLGTFKTFPEAMQCLIEYHKNPYSIEVESITFKEVYDKWSDSKFEKISASNINGYKASFKTSEPLHDMRFIDIKTAHLQSIMDKCGKGHGTRRKLKVLWGQLYSYALQNDIVNKNYAEFVEIGEKEDADEIHKPFTDDEIKILWDNVDRMDFIDTILITIYTGLRPGELVLIENKDINLAERYFRGGLKTAAGKNRVIPINKKIEPLIKSRMSDNQFLILNHENSQMSYYNYREEKFKKIMEQLNMDHLPHDGRHTFATLMDNAGANKVSIKRIMGHASKDITDKVYTHKDIDELLKAIDMI